MGRASLLVLAGVTRLAEIAADMGAAARAFARAKIDSSNAAIPVSQQSPKV
jgi:hypothetical protein